MTCFYYVSTTLSIKLKQQQQQQKKKKKKKKKTGFCLGGKLNLFLDISQNSTLGKQILYKIQYNILKIKCIDIKRMIDLIVCL